MPTACEPWPGKRNAMVIVTSAARPAPTEGGLRKMRAGSVVTSAARPAPTEGGLRKMRAGSVVTGAARPAPTEGGLRKMRAGSVVAGALRPAWTAGGLRETLVAPTRPISAAAPSCFSPTDEGGSPREAPAERDEEHEVAALQTAGGDGLLERDVDGRGARVAVPVDVHEHALHGKVDALGGRLDDAEVRLVRDEQVHVGRGEAVAAEDAFGAFDEQADGDLEHLVTPHLGVVHP